MKSGTQSTAVRYALSQIHNDSFFRRGILHPEIGPILAYRSMTIDLWKVLTRRQCLSRVCLPVRERIGGQSCGIVALWNPCDRRWKHSCEKRWTDC